MAQVSGSAVGSGAGMAIGSMYGPMGAMVGSSLGGLVGSMFDSGDSEALDALKKAQAQIQAIPVPTAQDLRLTLEPLVQQGILTPEAYQTILQQPSEFTSMNIDQTGRNAEVAGLNQLQDIANSGGQDAEYKQAMNEALNTSNTQLQGQNASIMQNASARGMPTSDLMAAQQLAQAQNGAYNMNAFSSNAAAQAEQRALQAMTESATLGGQLNQQDYAQAAQKAQAIDAINKYNAQNSQQQSNMNVQGRNQAQAGNLDLAQQVAQYNTGVNNQQAQWNAAIPQQVFADQLGKAGAMMGGAGQVSNMLQNNYQNQMTTQGNIIGGLGQNLTNYYNNQNLTNALKGLQSNNTTPAQSSSMANGTYGAQNPPPASAAQYAPTSNAGGWSGAFSEGGRVPGHAAVPGDDPRNDTVIAHVSPGEVIVPRSKAADPVSLAHFIANLPSSGTPRIHPEDVRTVLSALTAHRSGRA
jgi:hypothetical protein